MGHGWSSDSYFEVEKKTWSDHSTKYDNSVRESSKENLGNIKNNTKLYLNSTKSSWNNISFDHWFITDGTYFIEFGSVNSEIYKASVTINTKGREFIKENSYNMNDEIRERIICVLGLSNYSLVLRNSEHVAKYILKNNWCSSEPNTTIFNLFKKSKMKDILNTLPSFFPQILNDNENKKIYSFLNDHFTAKKIVFHCDTADDTYNILMLGPSGAGKSHLINVIFNQAICHSTTNIKSQTHDIRFIKGKGEIYDIEKKKFVTKDVVVADTVGLCDTELEDDKVISMIRDKVNSTIQHIDIVFIVIQTHRLSRECVKNIKKILSWLKYTNHSNRFAFVGTHADFLSEETKKKIKNEFETIFKIVPYRTVLINEAITAEETITNNKSESEKENRKIKNSQPINNLEHIQCTIPSSIGYASANKAVTIKETGTNNKTEPSEATQHNKDSQNVNDFESNQCTVPTSIGSVNANKDVPVKETGTNNKTEPSEATQHNKDSQNVNDFESNQCTVPTSIGNVNANKDVPVEETGTNNKTEPSEATQLNKDSQNVNDFESNQCTVPTSIGSANANKDVPVEETGTNNKTEPFEETQPIKDSQNVNGIKHNHCTVLSSKKSVFLNETIPAEESVTSNKSEPSDETQHFKISQPVNNFETNQDTSPHKKTAEYKEIDADKLISDNETVIKGKNATVFNTKNQKIDSFVLIGFPPEQNLDHNAKEMVISNFKIIFSILKFPPAGERINVSPSLCPIL